MVVMVFLAGLVAGGLLNALAEKSAAAYGCGQITETENPFEEVKRLWLGKRRTGIYWPYPLFVLLNALGWTGAVLDRGFGIAGGAGLFVVSLCLVLSSIDLECRILPDYLVGMFFLAGIIYHLCQGGTFILEGLLGAVTGFFSLFTVAALSRGGIGGGDIKLLTAMGVWLGYPVVFQALFSGALAGGVCGLALLVSRRKKPQDSIPFGPFLALGFLLVFFLGS